MLVCVFFPFPVPYALLPICRKWCLASWQIMWHTRVRTETGAVSHKGPQWVLAHDNIREGEEKRGVYGKLPGLGRSGESRLSPRGVRSWSVALPGSRPGDGVLGPLFVITISPSSCVMTLQSSFQTENSLTASHAFRIWKELIIRQVDVTASYQGIWFVKGKRCVLAGECKVTITNCHYDWDITNVSSTTSLSNNALFGGVGVVVRDSGPIWIHLNVFDCITKWRVSFKCYKLCWIFYKMVHNVQS